MKGKKNKSLKDQCYLLQLWGFPCMTKPCPLRFPHDPVLALTSHTASLMTMLCLKRKCQEGWGDWAVTCALPQFPHYHCSNPFVFQLREECAKIPNPSSKQNPHLMSYFFASLPICQFHINTLSHQHLKPSKP